MNNLYACDICNQTFKRKCRLDYHFRCHFPDENESIGSDNERKKHILHQPFDGKNQSRNSLNISEPKVSDDVLKAFGVVSDFTVKIEKSCWITQRAYAGNVSQKTSNEVKPFPCLVCDKRFLRYELLSHHMVLVHPGWLMTQSCSTSPDMIVDKNQLVLHSPKHDSTNNVGKVVGKFKGHFCCNICNIKLEDDLDMDVHMIKHTKAYPHCCGICSRRFSIYTNLWNHAWVHTDKKPYQCNKCGRYFGRRYRLRYHMAIHSDARPYECQQCEKSFKLKGSLTSHEKVHNAALEKYKMKKLAGSSNKVNCHEEDRNMPSCSKRIGNRVDTKICQKSKFFESFKKMEVNLSNISGIADASSHSVTEMKPKIYQKSKVSKSFSKREVNMGDISGITDASSLTTEMKTKICQKSKVSKSFKKKQVNLGNISGIVDASSLTTEMKTKICQKSKVSKSFRKRKLILGNISGIGDASSSLSTTEVKTNKCQKSSVSKSFRKKEVNLEDISGIVAASTQSTTKMKTKLSMKKIFKKGSRKITYCCKGSTKETPSKLDGSRTFRVKRKEFLKVQSSEPSLAGNACEQQVQRRHHFRAAQEKIKMFTFLEVNKEINLLQEDAEGLSSSSSVSYRDDNFDSKLTSNSKNVFLKRVTKRISRVSKIHPVMVENIKQPLTELNPKNMDRLATEELKIFKCNLCFKTYKHKASLDRHYKNGKHVLVEQQDILEEKDGSAASENGTNILEEEKGWSTAAENSKYRELKDDCKQNALPPSSAADFENSTLFTEEKGNGYDFDDNTNSNSKRSTISRAHNALDMAKKFEDRLELYVCQLCGKEYKYETSLNKHRKLKHNNNRVKKLSPQFKSYKDSNFDSKFTSNSENCSLKRVTKGTLRVSKIHPVTIENIKQPWTEVNKEKMAQLTSEELKIFNCNLCFKTYKNKASLDRHNRKGLHVSREQLDILDEKGESVASDKSTNILEEREKGCSASSENNTYKVLKDDGKQNVLPPSSAAALENSTFFTEEKGNGHDIDDSMNSDSKRSIMSKSHNELYIAEEFKDRLELYVCQLCSKEYKHKTSLNKHIKLKHRKKKVKKLGPQIKGDTSKQSSKRTTSFTANPKELITTSLNSQDPVTSAMGNTYIGVETHFDLPRCKKRRMDENSGPEPSSRSILHMSMLQVNTTSDEDNVHGQEGFISNQPRKSCLKLLPGKINQVSKCVTFRLNPQEKDLADSSELQAEDIPSFSRLQPNFPFEEVSSFEFLKENSTVNPGEISKVKVEKYPNYSVFTENLSRGSISLKLNLSDCTRKNDCLSFKMECEKEFMNDVLFNRKYNNDTESFLDESVVLGGLEFNVDKTDEELVHRDKDSLPLSSGSELTSVDSCSSGLDDRIPSDVKAGQNNGQCDSSKIQLGYDWSTIEQAIDLSSGMVDGKIHVDDKQLNQSSSYSQIPGSDPVVIEVQEVNDQPLANFCLQNNYEQPSWSHSKPTHQECMDVVALQGFLPKTLENSNACTQQEFYSAEYIEMEKEKGNNVTDISTMSGITTRPNWNNQTSIGALSQERKSSNSHHNLGMEFSDISFLENSASQVQNTVHKEMIGNRLSNGGEGHSNIASIAVNSTAEPHISLGIGSEITCIPNGDLESNSSYMFWPGLQDICVQEANQSTQSISRVQEATQSTQNNMCQCEYCGRKFTRSSTLKNHIDKNVCNFRKNFLEAQEDEKGLKCVNSVCSQNQVPNISNVDNASPRKVTKIRAKNYRCHICPKAYVAHSSLIKHVKKIHSNQIPEIMNCYIQGETSNGNDTLAKSDIFIDDTQEGIVSSTSVSSMLYKCNVCSCRFATEMNLLSHTSKKVCRPPFECRFCKKRFKVKSVWEKHMLAENAKIQSKEFTCCSCSTVFCSKRDLRIHKTVMRCLRCLKEFACHYLYDVHVRLNKCTPTENIDLVTNYDMTNGVEKFPLVIHIDENPVVSQISANGYVSLVKGERQSNDQDITDMPIALSNSFNCFEEHPLVNFKDIQPYSSMSHDVPVTSYAQSIHETIAGGKDIYSLANRKIAGDGGTGEFVDYASGNINGGKFIELDHAKLSASRSFIGIAKRYHVTPPQEPVNLITCTTPQHGNEHLLPVNVDYVDEFSKNRDAPLNVEGNSKDGSGSFSVEGGLSYAVGGKDQQLCLNLEDKQEPCYSYSHEADALHASNVTGSSKYTIQQNNTYSALPHFSSFIYQPVYEGMLVEGKDLEESQTQVRVYSDPLHGGSS